MTDHKPQVISIITPAHGATLEQVQPTAVSIAVARRELLQSRPRWRVEWLVEECPRGLFATLPPASWIKLGATAHASDVHAFNYALYEAAGELVIGIRPGALVTPDALIEYVRRFTDNPRIAWAVGRVHDLVMPNGDPIEPDFTPREGLYRAGQLLRDWKERGWKLPVHPDGACMRTPLLRELGGWAALPTSTATAPLIAAAARFRGYVSLTEVLQVPVSPGSAPQPANAEAWRTYFAPVIRRAEAARAIAMASEPWHQG